MAATKKEPWKKGIITSFDEVAAQYLVDFQSIVP